MCADRVPLRNFLKIMLISFTVGNFRSFWEPKTLSLVPASISDYPQNIIKKSNVDLLSSAVLYGANASGKSNFLFSMNSMKLIVEGTYSRQSTSEMPYQPFLLNLKGKEQPTFYEVSFWIDGIRYRYGFEADQKMIHSEWLFFTEKKAEKPLFMRVRDGIEVMRGFPEGRNLEEKTKGNTLFLTVVDQFNGKIAASAMKWFKDISYVSGVDDTSWWRLQTINMLAHQPPYDRILNKLYRDSDLGFDNVNAIKDKYGAVDYNDLQLKTTHQILDENQVPVGTVEFDARGQESSGTNKFIDLSGQILYTLSNGGVLVIDELDAKLHPLLTLAIVRLFQDQEVNKHGAQLIFATHDTNILSMCNLRRDQIYFVEKNKYHASDLYSLIEYNLEGKVRKDRSFEKDYLNGRYGAVPYFGNFDNLM